jgi:hypothetical protein
MNENTGLPEATTVTTGCHTLYKGLIIGTYGICSVYSVPIYAEVGAYLRKKLRKRIREIENQGGIGQIENQGGIGQIENQGGNQGGNKNNINRIEGGKGGSERRGSGKSGSGKKSGKNGTKSGSTTESLSPSAESLSPSAEIAKLRLATAKGVFAIGFLVMIASWVVAPSLYGLLFFVYEESLDDENVGGEFVRKSSLRREAGG